MVLHNYLSCMEWFSYLKHLDVPGKLKISHSIIEKLVASDLQLVENSDILNFDDIVDHGSLSRQQAELEETIKRLSVKETAFHIAQLEYEKKEARFLEKTNYNSIKLDQIYAEKDLVLKDINDSALLAAIADRDWDLIVSEIADIISVIGRDVDIFNSRIEFLLKLWVQLSRDLSEKIKSFEYRGMKVISTNLRLKLVPILEEFKTALKDHLLKEESLSRGRIEIELMDMVKQAREDLYGDLTGSQVVLLDEINPELTKEELIRIIKDEKIREDLEVLLETDKIEIRMKKVIDRLI